MSLAAQTTPNPKLVLGSLLLVQLLFGMNYVISKVVVTAFPPLVWASIRISVATLFMMGFALITKRKHPKDGAKFFVPLIGLSLLGMIINQGSFLMGLRYTTPSNSAILNTMIPIFTLLIVTLRGQERLTRFRVLGFLLAFLGVLSLRKVEEFHLSDKTAWGDLLTLVNCLSYALFLSYGKKFLETHDRVWTTAWLFLYGTVGLTLVALPDYASFTLPELNTTLIWCMVFAIIGGTLTTYFLNLWALAHTHSSSVALYIYIQPVIASLLGFFWFGDHITTRTLLSGGLIFCGMLLSRNRQLTV